jgi:hypothetical protein
MFGAHARFVVVAISAAALYYWLIVHAVSYAFVIVPGREALLDLIDAQQLATHLWLQLSHTLGVLVAAVPIAALIQFTCRPHATATAVIAGTLTALGSLLPTVMTEAVRATLSDTQIVVQFLDSVKIAAIVTTLVWLGGRLSSNNALEQSREG